MWSDLTLGPQSAYNTLNIAPKDLVFETNRKSWARNPQTWLDLTLGPSFKVEQR